MDGDDKNTRGSYERLLLKGGGEISTPPDEDFRMVGGGVPDSLSGDAKRTSVDGKPVVFVAAVAPDHRSELYWEDQDGQNLTFLVPHGVRSPVVSPDGKYIAYIELSKAFEVRTVGRIVRIDGDGRNRRVLASQMGWVNLIESDIRELSWSPVGKWLTFDSKISGQFQIYIVPVDGTYSQQAFKFPGNAVFSVEAIAVNDIFATTASASRRIQKQYKCLWTMDENLTTMIRVGSIMRVVLHIAFLFHYGKSSDSGVTK
jgi:hypothetical protein